MGETPEHYLVCYDVVLGKANAYMTYTPNELGIASDRQVINVWRSAEQQFRPETILSANAKDVTDSHPPNFIDSSTFSQFSKGHLQNIHQGLTYEDNDLLLCDAIIKDAVLISKIKGGLRATSGGYSYSLFCRLCDKLLPECQCDTPEPEQRDIVYNHLAVVGAARAGEQARIQDSKSSVTANQLDATLQLSKQGRLMPDVEKKSFARSWLHALGITLQKQAQDASPEVVEELTQDITNHEAIIASMGGNPGPGTVKNNMTLNEEALARAYRRGLDARRKGHDEDDEPHVPGCKCNDCETTDGKLDAIMNHIKGINAKDGKKSKDAEGSEEMGGGENIKPMPSLDRKEFDEFKKSVDGTLKEIKDGLMKMRDSEGEIKSKESAEEKPSNEVKDADIEEFGEEKEKEEKKPEAKDDENFKLVSESIFHGEELPYNPMPGATKVTNDAAVEAIKELLAKEKRRCANDANFPSKASARQAREAYNAKKRLLLGEDAGAAGNGMTYGKLARTAKPDDVRQITDGRRPQTMEEIAAASNDQINRSGAAKRGEKVPEKVA
jgi:hypothetical protein